MIENKHIEYKEKVTQDFEREVVAFLNSNEGGAVYFGINKFRKIVGLNDIDQDQLLIKDRLKNNILPSCMGLFDLIVEKKEDKDVIKLIVAGGYEKPYYIKKYGLSEKGAFIRVGSSSEPMPTRQIEQLFSKRIRNSIATIKSPKKRLQFQQLHIYYQSIGKKLNDQFAHNLELLNEDGDYNYLSYLVNDINTISVKVARYQGLSRVNLVESNEYGYESIIKATYQVLEKLNIENRTLTEITSTTRKEQRLWNAIALREAVINAMEKQPYNGY
ncbi:MAG: ATP-binding protein [Bacteroidales bacterium]